MNKNIKICFMGTPIFGANVLKRLIDEYQVVLVVTQPDKKGKRGNELIASPVKILAQSFNIPIFQPEKIKEDFSEMTKYDFDFLVTAAYGQFIPLDVLHLAKFLTLNVHGSLLPKYRGGAPIQRAIQNGDPYLGVSIIRTIMKMDAGVVYKQSTVECKKDDTTESMADKLSKVGAEDLIGVINAFYSGNTPVEMHQTIDEVTFAYNISKEEETLNFKEDAYELANKIRAFYPDPLTNFTMNGVTYIVYKAEAFESDSVAEPGTILNNESALLIKCGHGALSLLIIQSPSKKAMPIKDFLNGKRSLFPVGRKIE